MKNWVTEDQEGRGLYSDYLFNTITGRGGERSGRLGWERKRRKGKETVDRDRGKGKGRKWKKVKGKDGGWRGE